MAKLLILGSWHGGASCTEFARAAATLGHEVIRCGPRFTEADAARWAETIRGMEWVTEGEAERYVQEVLAASPVPEIEKAKGGGVWHHELPAHDALIAFWQYGESPGPVTTPATAMSGVPSALVVGDTHTGHLPEQRREANAFAHLFLQFRPADLAAFDHPSKHWLPPAADPQVWVCAQTLPFPKTWDVCLVASTDRQVHRERVALVEHLRAQGLDVHVEHSFGHRAAFAYNQSKVVLNCSLAGDINLRVPEALMAGAALVTDDVEGLAEMGLHDDRAISAYGPGERTAEAVVRFLLDHEDYRLKQARWGRAVALKRHTWEHRVREVLEVMGVGDGDDRERTRERTDERRGTRDRAGAAGAAGGGGAGPVGAGGASGGTSAAPGGLVIPAASVIIPAYGHQDLTYRLAETVVGEGREVLVVDDASPDEFPPPPEGVRLYTTARNGGFAAACNAGAKEAEGDVLVFLNNDCSPRDGWLEPLLEELDRGALVVGPLILNPDGTVQSAGLEQHADGTWWNRTDAPEERREERALMGACLAIRRSTFWLVGGFDEQFPSGGEDVDLALRVQRLFGR